MKKKILEHLGFFFLEEIELPKAGIERGSPTPMSGLTHWTAELCR